MGLQTVAAVEVGIVVVAVVEQTAVAVGAAEGQTVEVGTVEEINFRSVIIKLWNWRRLIVPVSFFLEKSFQNWNRVEHANLIERVFLYVDFAMPVERLRSKLDAILNQSDLWDKQVGSLQVSELLENTMQLKILASARNSDDISALTAHIREELMTYIVQHFPDFLPKTRTLNLSEKSAGRTVSRVPVGMDV